MTEWRCVYLGGLIGFILVCVGLFHSLAPRAAWYIHYGWRFQDAEPSDLYLGFLRVTGVLAIIVGVIVIIVAIVG